MLPHLSEACILLSLSLTLSTLSALNKLQFMKKETWKLLSLIEFPT